MTKPFNTLERLRAGYPTPMSNEQLGQLLNATAWAHRADGFGLFRKPSGGHCPQPQTGIFVSRDILMLPDGQMFDCLIDAEGAATPTWGEKDPRDPKLWVAPVDAAIALPPPVTGPTAEPTTIPYPGDHLGTQIGDYLFSDYAQAGQDPNSGMGVWFLRVAWDVANPPYLTPAKSLEKHRAEWRRLLGL